MSGEAIKPRRIGGLMGATIDEVCADDAAWFAAHPDASVRIRRRVPDELFPWEDEAPLAAFPFMRVTQPEPGLRTREPLACLISVSLS